MDSPPTDHSNEAQVADNEPGADPSPSRSGRLVAGAVVAALIAGFFLFAAFSGGGGDGDGGSAAAGDSPIANLAFTTENGGTATLADFQGEPIVLNFFASWCAPCRAEMPEFEEVHLAREGEVKFLGVSHDIDEATWANFVAETEVTFETVFQPNTEIWTELDAKGMPSTAFIAPDGEIKHLYTGVLNEDLLQDLIDEHLAGGA